MSERFAGRYTLVDHLGDGGAGSVWRAWDARRGQYVAAKLLRQRDAGALLRFVREQSLRVAHPHVVAPTGWAAEDDDVLLTMELVRGGSVATLLGDHHRLPPATVAVLLDQLLDALDAVHRAGVVHRDVKPANLLLDPTGTAPPFLRLADFGIAAHRDDARLTDTGYVVGTGGYVAPEVLHGSPPAAPQDVWAAGTVGLQLLSGVRPPFPPGGPPLPESPLVGLLAGLADPDPARRPDAAGARAALAALGPLPAGDEPVEVFDHLPPLPAGWTTSGPAGNATAQPPRSWAEPDTGVAPAGRATATVPATWTAQPPTAQHPTAQDPTARPPAARSTTAQPTSAPRTTAPRAGAERAPEGRGRLALRLAAVALLVLLALLAFSRARSGAGGPEAPAGLPATGARAGDACAFSEVGLRRSADGALVTCRLRDGAYRWTRG